MYCTVQYSSKGQCLPTTTNKTHSSKQLLPDFVVLLSSDFNTAAVTSLVTYPKTPQTCTCVRPIVYASCLITLITSARLFVCLYHRIESKHRRVQTKCSSKKQHHNNVESADAAAGRFDVRASRCSAALQFRFTVVSKFRSIVKFVQIRVIALLRFHMRLLQYSFILCLCKLYSLLRFPSKRAVD
jgi:hypothetical protein